MKTGKKVNKREEKTKGQQYMTSTKNIIPPRKMGNSCSCPNKCWEKVNGDAEHIFNSFWDLGNHVSQNTYLIHSIKLLNKKRCYTKEKHSRREFNFEYYVKVNAVDVKICKEMFLALHGLQNSRKRIENNQNQIKSGNVVAKADGRGKHKNRPHAFSEEILDIAREFINSIPKYVSHYSRNQNPNRQYLDCDLTINSLYKQKCRPIPWCKSQNKQSVSSDRFRRLFCEEFCIGFKIPKSDTCAECDYLNVQIENIKGGDDEVQLRDLETRQSLHQRKATAAQDKLHLLSTLAQSCPEKYHVISIDLQQALPTPKLTVGPAFYRRKLWTFNCGTDSGFMFLWSENIAKRGACEIASCLLKYLQDNNIEAEELHIMSDNCKGQNKNWFLIALYASLIQSGRFKFIYHHFLVVGHTRLPCDRDFSRIELHALKHYPVVYRGRLHY